jgi:hypothetical protein
MIKFRYIRRAVSGSYRCLVAADVRERLSVSK